MQNEVYYQRYLDLFRLIYQAYLDCGILEELSQYKELAENNGWTLPSMSMSVLVHFCELAKCDLVLSLSKLTDDTDDSNTIPKFKGYIESGLKKKVSYDESEINQINATLKSSRDTFLAHNDKKKKGLPLEVSYLFQSLETVRKAFNSLCLRDIDDRVKPVSESAASQYKAKVEIGLHMLLLNSSNASSPTEKQDEE